MTDRVERDRAAAQNGGRVLRPRAWAAPVRAMTRILNADGTPRTAQPAGPDRTGIVDCGLYVDGERQPGEWTYAEALEAARRERHAFVWLGLHEPELAEMSAIADTYGLHELAVEDAVKAQQRPKLEQFGEVSFLVLRTARYCEHTELTENSEVVETGQVMLFIGPKFLISVRHGDACRLAPVRADLEAKRDLLRHGPWAVAYAITDRVVDLYLEVADQLEDDLDVLEADVFDRQGTGRIQRIYQMKRELVEFKRAVMPLQRPLMSVTSQVNREVPQEVRRYFRDVQDHLSRTVEQVNSYDDLLNSILQARLAQVTVDQNNDMRKIAAWAAIGAVWTAIAGIYGMNFKYMPELDWTYGYPGVWALMLASSFTLYRLFRRNGWL
ncbi:magnesium and cobalt transport protein CorA [Micromonospora globispora]|uniref:Magnesium transport protein CorA n=1 Tax=Micromonospora globispora TaxID=1450148 RepID=A0A317KJJ3_9ACTN|nr:magnesium/cobalt transporter CorA [Micromonospora globispora]PWU53784.1 magnesium and cobalt transport protein CorA [Micromonospora globispora]PWU60117.1 magnesium and cobalt transport protein CorA [Micromonospora globispora]RQW95182.1 magnesium and cobalt transport protein CorA [Micromonospora globispora]